VQSLIFQISPMALTSSIFLLALCSSGVQGSNLDLASTLQGRMDSHADAPWKAQAQGFIGLLQSMGKQVPSEKQGETRTTVEKLINLLTTASDDLKSSSKTEVDKLDTEVTSETGLVNEYDTKAKKFKQEADGKNGELKTCYQELRVQNANYYGSCAYAGGSLLEVDAEVPQGKSCSSNGGSSNGNIIKTPQPCVEMENTKLLKFDVAEKFTWQCNFTAGETSDSCTDENSALKKDLLQKKQALVSKALAWNALKGECDSETETECQLCDDTVSNTTVKKAACELLFNTTSDKLCAFTESVHTREEHLLVLKSKRQEAIDKTSWDAAKTQWIDLNLIICVFRRFNASMNFQADDFSECKKEVADFVPEPKVVELPATFSHENIKFGGGLADKYLGMPDAQSGTPMPASPREVTASVKVLAKAAASGLYLSEEKLVEVQVCNGGDRV